MIGFARFLLQASRVSLVASNPLTEINTSVRKEVYRKSSVVRMQCADGVIAKLAHVNDSRDLGVDILSFFQHLY